MNVLLYHLLAIIISLCFEGRGVSVARARQASLQNPALQRNNTDVTNACSEEFTQVGRCGRHSQLFFFNVNTVQFACFCNVKRYRPNL